MKDFTTQQYARLIKALKSRGYRFVTFAEFLKSAPDEKVVVLRHDVDLKPANSMRIATIENHLGAKASYYFRAVPESWDDDIIRAIASLGHEIGYHYESLTTTGGNVTEAYADFCKNLEKLRLLAPVATICMHGSPRSPYDSKDLWKTYDYHDLGIEGEPYFDVDFNHTFYLTDTGRRWDGYKVSVRDKVGHEQEWEQAGLAFHTTEQIIKALNADALPSRIMITTHPQRWSDGFVPWLRELCMQKAKNVVKRMIVNKQANKK